MMDKVIGELGLKVERNYMDDIIIGSETFEKYLEDLESIFIQLEKVELRIKLISVNLLKIGNILGTSITIGRVKLNSIKVKVICNINHQ
jgi:hypothetical protein